ncbi:hypothetical protein [Archangium violaceum]|uniref:hypothetical protein n=1 Tax=Archangium violaceum TaxID=83451 RepID=UPI0036DD6552
MTELTVIDCAQPPPPPNGEGTQLVSLSAELSMLEDALTAAANIAEFLAMKSLPSDEAATQAPVAISAVLVVVTARMTHLRRVLSCEADPRELLATHNSVPENDLGDPDVHLRPWTAAQRVVHLRRLLTKAEAEAKREEPTQPSP